MNDSRPLIVHIVFRFDFGGMENGVVNVVNGLADSHFRHVIVALSEATDFAKRLRDSVPVYAIGKQPGKDFGAYWRLYKLFRKLRPDIVHTRNFGSMDCALIAFAARVPARIHGEHGWDVYDPDGRVRKYRWMRKLLSVFINQYITVSKDLRQWLISTVGIEASRIIRICNGVDVERFSPRAQGTPDLLPKDRFPNDSIVVGSVCRFSAIKDPLNLVEAFILLKRHYGEEGRRLRLLMIGDGELRTKAQSRLEESGYADAAWLPGSRNDIPELMRAINVFVLGSLREGISNTILEAMASGLPVVATSTGGNLELVEPGQSGDLVPPANPRQLAESIAAYVDDPALLEQHGQQARKLAVSEYSLQSMVENYRQAYQQSLQRRELRECAE